GVNLRSLLMLFVAPTFLRHISFFFQAEDGIRDRNVTGVQTCALPILMLGRLGYTPNQLGNMTYENVILAIEGFNDEKNHEFNIRSEERRVGKECKSRWSTYQSKNKRKSK